MVSSVAFIAWAWAFIHVSSFVSPDGVRRYYLFDDSMISMRYAWNLVHGQGLVWNPGARVEGITDFLMTLYMAVWCSFLSKEAAALAVQLSGVAFVLVAAIFSSRVVIRAAMTSGGDASSDRLSPRPASCWVLHCSQPWSTDTARSCSWFLYSSAQLPTRSGSGAILGRTGGRWLR